MSFIMFKLFLMFMAVRVTVRLRGLGFAALFFTCCFPKDKRIGRYKIYFVTHKYFTLVSPIAGTSVEDNRCARNIASAIIYSFHIALVSKQGTGKKKARPTALAHEEDGNIHVSAAAQA